MLRTCKVCGVAGDYKPWALGTKAKGFHGWVCYTCYILDQRAWRGTALGRDEANEASRAYRMRKRNADSAPRDV